MLFNPSLGSELVLEGWCGRLCSSAPVPACGSVAVIGPLTVQPRVEGGVGRGLMEAAVSQAKKAGFSRVRLVQSPSHIRSFVLYTKSGFVLREPLFLMQGAP